MRPTPMVLGEPIPLRSLIAMATALLSAAMIRLTYPAAALLLGEDRGRSAIGVIATVAILGLVRGWSSTVAATALRPAIFAALSRALRGAPLVGGLPRPEEIESTIARGAPWIESYLTVTLPIVAGNLVALPITVVLAASHLGWAVATLSLAAVAIGGFSAIVVSRRAGEIARRAWEKYQPVATLLDSAIRARAELRAHRLESSIDSELKERLRSWSRHEREAQLAAAITSFGVPAISILAALALSTAFDAHPIAWLERTVRSPSRDTVVGGLLLFSAVPILVGVARGLADIGLERRYLMSLERFVMAFGRSGSGIRALPPLIQRIEFDDVAFSYPAAAAATSTTTVRAHFAWDTREVLAVVGPNGSGKTTLGWLVMGLLEPTSGTIRFQSAVDGRAGERTTSIAYLAQQAFWDAGATIREAIHFGAPAADDAAIENVLRALFNQTTFARSENILERSVAALSGGERRLVALARTFLRDGELIVLDEPEAGLDQEARSRVARFITQRKGRASLVLLTHDPVFIRVADRVLSFDAEHRLSSMPEPLERAH